MEQPITIDSDVAIIETRGRPVSPEYAALVKMKVNDSFTSKKSRDTLYQIARNLGFRVTILWTGPKEGWRVWKKGPRIIKPELEAGFAPRPKKRKRSKASAR